jgi:hypothetical protein
MPPIPAAAKPAQSKFPRLRSRPVLRTPFDQLSFSSSALEISLSCCGAKLRERSRYRHNTVCSGKTNVQGALDVGPRERLKAGLTVPRTADNKAAKIAVVFLVLCLLFINNGKPSTVWLWSDVSE